MYSESLNHAVRTSLVLLKGFEILSKMILIVPKCKSYYILVKECPLDHPYAYLNGAKCCASDEELENGGTKSEIESGTCDGIGFDIESSCCKNHSHVKCPGNSCIDNNDAG